MVCGSCVSSALQWSFQTSISVADFGMSSNKMMMSSIDRGPVYKPRQDVLISCWSVPGALQSLSGLARPNWYSPCAVAKTVFSWLAGSTWRDQALKTIAVQGYQGCHLSSAAARRLSLSSPASSLYGRKKTQESHSVIRLRHSYDRPDDDQGPCKS